MATIKGAQSLYLLNSLLVIITLRPKITYFTIFSLFSKGLEVSVGGTQKKPFPASLSRTFCLDSHDEQQ